MPASPAFQFYPDDFLGSGKVGTMTLRELGAYTMLLCLDWNEVGFVYDEEELARWCRCTRKDFRAVWPRVSRCFVERGGRLYNPRLEAEREKQRVWREKSAKGGRRSGEVRSKGGSSVVGRVVEPPNEPNTNTPSPSPTPVTTTASSSTVAARLATDADREALGSLLSRVPNPDAWTASIVASLDGMAGHEHVTPTQLGQALREFEMNRADPNGRLFRRYLASAKQDTDRPVTSLPRGGVANRTFRNAERALEDL